VRPEVGALADRGRRRRSGDGDLVLVGQADGRGEGRGRLLPVVCPPARHAVLGAEAAHRLLPRFIASLRLSSAQIRRCGRSNCSPEFGCARGGGVGG
jgi:hypothetical protein